MSTGRRTRPPSAAARRTRSGSRAALRPGTGTRPGRSPRGGRRRRARGGRSPSPWTARPGSRACAGERIGLLGGRRRGRRDRRARAGGSPHWSRSDPPHPATASSAMREQEACRCAERNPALLRNGGAALAPRSRHRGTPPARIEQTLTNSRNLRPLGSAPCVPRLAVSASGSLSGWPSSPDQRGRRPGRSPNRRAAGREFRRQLRLQPLAMDDPIVYPRSRARRTTTASSATRRRTRSRRAPRCAPARPRAARRRDSRVLDADALLNGQLVTPTGATIYYRRKPLAPVRAVPGGLEDDRAATRTRPRRRARRSPSGTAAGRHGGAFDRGARRVPTRGSHALRLHVNFPSCWDGKTSTARTTRATWLIRPRRMPRVTSRRTAGDLVDLPLSDHGRRRRDALLRRAAYSGHADFFNAWRQTTLSALVKGCLDALRHCARGT